MPLSRMRSAYAIADSSLSCVDVSVESVTVWSPYSPHLALGFTSQKLGAVVLWGRHADNG